MTTAASMLFSWADVERLGDLKRLERVLAHLPDRALIEALKARRGRGRDDYPVEAMWRALIAGVVFQHDSIASLLRELRRNPGLLQVCGFAALPRQGRTVRTLKRDAQTGQARVVSLPAPAYDNVPDACNFSRFLSGVVSLEEQRGLVSGMTDVLRTRLMEALPDFGRHLGYDGKALDSHSTGRANRKTGKTSDPDADWGCHETRGVDKTGRAWSKVKSWFGYELHVIADSVYETPVWHDVTRASVSEVKRLSGAVDELFGSSPELARRCADFSADRGLDSGKLKAKLWDRYGVRPLIDTRAMWREEKEVEGFDPSEPILRVLHPDRVDTILYSEKGEVLCRDPATKEQRPMAFTGFESDRGTLKYRCPAAAYGFACQGRAQCYRGAGVTDSAYGRVVRIALKDYDRRIFTPTPWGSPSWRRGYKRRTALERINSRMDSSYGFERHFIRGQAKMKTRMGLAVCVMMALALGAALEGRPGRMRSLVNPPFHDAG